MKRVFAIVLAFAMALSFSTVASAENDITVLINETEVEFDVPPMIVNDRTMVPMRRIFEKLGAQVEWIEEMRIALATYKTSIVAIGIDEYSFSVTDVSTGQSRSIPLDVPSQIVDGHTLIPLRAVSQALGKTVEWDGATRTVKITG